ncbi:MAG TPA: V-type ATP synthase subunit D [Burkholderiaceae bacterium]|nr:V-type ATP synthase subunit D [Burkholderiaceae bacterium]
MAEASDTSPTRSAVIALKDERRAMHEGYVFLDEKCLLLASEILRPLELYARLQRELLALHERAREALRAAVLRHGLQGLQVYPAADLGAARLRVQPRALMGVRLQEAKLDVGATTPAPQSVERSPEAQACRDAFAAVLAAAATVAAVAGNLERLSLEYRRSVRRARALQDVMLPELDATIADIENRLEELERDEAIFGRVRR